MSNFKTVQKEYQGEVKEVVEFGAKLLDISPKVLESKIENGPKYRLVTIGFKHKGEDVQKTAMMYETNVQKGPKVGLSYKVEGEVGNDGKMLFTCSSLIYSERADASEFAEYFGKADTGQTNLQEQGAANAQEVAGV